MVALMRSLCFSFIVLASIATLFSVADAHKFQVGGKGDWVEKPHEGYNSWAESKRFKVHDTLHFKYAKGSDSVQVVAKGDYDACNVNNPIEKFDNGDTEIALNRSGPFYFISGNQEHCTKGQKLIVFVLAIRNQPKVPISPAKAPSTAQPPKSHSPVVAPAKAPSTAHSPKSHSPISPVAPAKAPSTAKSPTAHSPASHISPAKAPSTAQPPKAHSPVSPTTPAKAPTIAHSPKSSVSPSPHPVAHSPAVSPSKAPATSPAKHSPSPSPTNSPRSSPATPPKHSPSTPEKPPKSTPASPAPEKTPPSSPTPSDNNMAPAPSPSAASVVTVTSVMSTLFTVAFTVSMFA